MTIRFAAVLLTLAFATPALADDPPAEAPVAERADAQAARIADDTGRYLEELDHAIKLANDGQYGKLPRGSGDRLAGARQTIGGLLKDGVDPRSLQPEQRIELFNAHQTIESIIKKNDKDRVVCTRETQIGSRVATTECLTVGEREERARTAQRGTESIQRAVCTPGPGNACTK